MYLIVPLLSLVVLWLPSCIYYWPSSSLSTVESIVFGRRFRVCGSVELLLAVSRVAPEPTHHAFSLASLDAAKPHLIHSSCLA
jgi:hypothetical protein